MQNVEATDPSDAGEGGGWISLLRDIATGCSSQHRMFTGGIRQSAVQHILDRFLWRGLLGRDFRGNAVDPVGDRRVEQVGRVVAGTLEPRCPRDADPRFADSVIRTPRCPMLLRDCSELSPNESSLRMRHESVIANSRRQQPPRARARINPGGIPTTRPRCRTCAGQGRAGCTLAQPTVAVR